MPHQTMALQSDAASDSPLEFVWRVDEATGLPLNLFAPAGSATRAVRCDAPFDEPTPYYWVVSGIESSSAGLSPGRLVLLAQRIVATPGKGLGFGVLGTTLIAVDNAADSPTAWRFRSANLTRCARVRVHVRATARASACVCVHVHVHMFPPLISLLTSCCAPPSRLFDGSRVAPTESSQLRLARSRGACFFSFLVAIATALRDVGSRNLCRPLPRLRGRRRMRLPGRQPRFFLLVLRGRWRGGPGAHAGAVGGAARAQRDVRRV